MLRGQLPAPGVLERLGLPQYAPLAEAVRSGAVRGLNQALLADQHRFIMEARPRHCCCQNADAALHRHTRVLHCVRRRRARFTALTLLVAQPPLATMASCLRTRARHVRCQTDRCRSQGVYLVLEKLKMPAYRRLFRRVALLHAEQEPAKAVQVPLGALACTVPASMRQAVLSLHGQ